MSVNFRFCGELRQMKGSDKFKPFETKTFGTGWSIDTFTFQGVNGSNKHMFQIKAGYWSDKTGKIDSGRMQIYTVFQQTDDDGNTSYTNTQIDYSDRFDDDILKDIPAYKKMVVDLNKPGEERKDALRKEFIYEGDLIQCMRRLFSSEKYDGVKFNVSGVVEMQYSTKNNKFYQSYVVQRVSIAKEDAKPRMSISGEFIFAPGSLEATEDGRMIYNVWSMYYDRQFKNEPCKGHIPAPMSFVFAPEYITDDVQKQKIVAEKLKERMSVVPDGAQYGTIKLEADVIDGAQVEEVTIDDLPQEIREDIEMGIRDLDEEIRRNGRKGFGPRIREFRLTKANEAKSSIYEDDDILTLPTASSYDSKPKTEATKSEKDDDLAPFDMEDVDDIFDL